MSTTDEELQELRDAVAAKNEHLAVTRAEREQVAQQTQNDIDALALVAELERIDAEIAFEERVASMSPVSVGDVPREIASTEDAEAAMLAAVEAQNTPPPPPPATPTPVPVQAPDANDSQKDGDL
jgi:hypothetical protein